MKTCRKGHHYETSARECPDCRKARKKAWIQTHPAEHAAKVKASRDKKKESV